MAAARPELVKALVLEDPAWLTETQAAAYKRGAEDEIGRLRAITANPAAAIERALEDHPGRQVRELGAWSTAKGQVDVRLVRTGVVGLVVPRQHLASQIAVPCLLLTGDQPGVLFTDEDIASIVSVGNPLLRTSTIVGAGHSIRRDRPEEFYEAVEAFLREVQNTDGMHAH